MGECWDMQKAVSLVALMAELRVARMVSMVAMRVD
jgi:hypothetical protein